MRMDKLTSKFQMALADAQSQALGRDNPFVEPEHVLKALVEQDGGTCRPLLEKTGINVTQLQTKLNEALEKMPKVSGTGGEIHISNSLMRLLNLCDKLAQQKKDAYISSELFILAAISEEGNLAKILKQVGGSR